MPNNQLEDLASKGRYGDTMLAHINPQEAALLKARGGSGTINPQTGLREFFGGVDFNAYQKPSQDAPVLSQAFKPDAFKDVLDELNKTTIPAQFYGRVNTPAHDVISSEYDQYAIRHFSPRGGPTAPEGYLIPINQTFQGQPLVAQYDDHGNFEHITLEPGKALTPDPSRPNIQAAPLFNRSGGITNYGAYDTNADQGGFFSSFISDFGPMILAGLGANLFGGLNLLGDAGAAAGGLGGATAGDIAASNALANANMANYAGLASDAGISMAGVAPGTLASDALASANLQYAGATPVDAASLTDLSTAGGLPPTDPYTFNPNYNLSSGLDKTGIKATLDPTRIVEGADFSINPVDYSINPTTTGGPGLKLPTMPALNSMNGAQGLTTPAFGDPGTVGAKGLTPINAVPDLGDPKSFINDPNVTGQPGLNSDLPTTSLPNLKDAIDTAKKVIDTVKKLTPTTPKGSSTPTGGLSGGTSINMPALCGRAEFLTTGGGSGYKGGLEKLQQIYSAAPPPEFSHEANFAGGGTADKNDTDQCKSPLDIWKDTFCFKNITPKFVCDKPEFLYHKGTSQTHGLTPLKNIYSSMQGSYAKGGLPEKYHAAAPKGHNPEFITGVTGYYACGRGTGQSDDIPAMLHDGDYVMDAETVSALGDGSSKAGRHVLEGFRTQIPHKADGGSNPVPAKIADGEYVFPAAFVTALGGGDNKRGAEILDGLRTKLRAHKRGGSLDKIPPKAKDPIDYIKKAKG
jgi:hypothetical protein